LSKAGRRKRAGAARSAASPPARLFQRAEERAERLTTLSRLTRLIASATESDAAFRAIAEAATTLLKAKTAYVWVDEGGETLREGGSFWAEPELAGRIVRTTPVPRSASIALTTSLSRPAQASHVLRPVGSQTPLGGPSPESFSESVTLLAASVATGVRRQLPRQDFHLQETLHLFTAC